MNVVFGCKDNYIMCSVNIIHSFESALFPSRCFSSALLVTMCLFLCMALKTETQPVTETLILKRMACAVMYGVPLVQAIA
jgi:hypothetical protein